MKTEAKKAGLLRWGLLLAGTALVAAAALRHEARAAESASRSFGFNYEIVLKDVPALTKVARVWIPLAVSDEHQKVELVTVLSPVASKRMKDPEYGNELLFSEVYDPSSRVARFVLVFHATRTEFSGKPTGVSTAGVRPALFERFLKPDRLVPTGGKFKELSDQITQGKTNVSEKARAIYDYVLTTMKPDSTGEGPGRGDAAWALESKRGNCADFHSVFISLARAAGIPARFVVGFSIPEEQNGEIAGYHCWAEFYVEGTGWIPVDISEASKAPAKKDYYFGSLDANRIQFTTGRDLTLEPRQEGPALNYFVYPYVEVDGKPFDGKIERKFSYRNLAATAK
jgi:transglutaminase-like putative cysteine protease